MSVHPAKTQISLGISPVWSESLLCASWVAEDPSFFRADSEDSDQTGRMPRLIWVFTGCTVILLVLSWGGSFLFTSWRRMLLETMQKWGYLYKHCEWFCLPVSTGVARSRMYHWYVSKLFVFFFFYFLTVYDNLHVFCVILEWQNRNKDVISDRHSCKLPHIQLKNITLYCTSFYTESSKELLIYS